MPIAFREKERKYKEKWLPDYFGIRLEAIRSLVKHLHVTKENIPQVKWFTPHGDTHCKAVEDLLHQLIPENRHECLTEDEKFFLLGSAWLHDIGMTRGIMGEEKETITDEQIRDGHHLRSAQFIISNYRAVGVEESEKEAFGLLARFHRRRCPLIDCPELLPIPAHNSIRLRLLAAYLRLADALHIDQTRAPDAQYAISLAYDIPNKSKLHWLRSKFVLGLDINVKKKEIAVHLKYPVNIEAKEEYKLRTMERTLNSIYDLIVQDLSAELDTVKDVLFSSNISYFLRITKKVHKVEFDRQLLRDINSVFNYYFLLDNPSSSSLYTLMLQSIQEIIGSYSLNVSENKHEIEISAIKAVKSFLDEIDERVLGSRKCHTGLRNFVEEIREILKAEKIDELRSMIGFKSWLLELKRTGVRFSAYRYFHKKLEEDFWQDVPYPPSHEFSESKNTGGKDKPVRYFNIILYGYSELVIKSLTGFRDAIITRLIKKYNNDINEIEEYKQGAYPWQDKLSDTNEEPEIRKVYDDIFHKGDKNKNNNILTHKNCKYKRLPLFHKIEFEKKASEYFRIFVCEGQPKNRTTWGGRTIYHDGTRYAISLVQHGFTNVFVIPDAAVTTLMDPYGKQREDFPKINFVMVGANGYDDEEFLHSAGHATVATVTNYAREMSCTGDSKTTRKSDLPALILAIITDKYRQKDSKPKQNGNSEMESKSPDKENDSLIVTDGWKFHGAFAGEPIRTHIFISQDQELRNNLSNEAPTVSFYNPREDRIPISCVDVVITEKAWLVKNIEIENGNKWNGTYITKKNKDSSGGKRNSDEGSPAEKKVKSVNSSKET